jgi:integrase
MKQQACECYRFNHFSWSAFTANETTLISARRCRPNSRSTVRSFDPVRLHQIDQELTPTIKTPFLPSKLRWCHGSVAFPSISRLQNQGSLGTSGSHEQQGQFYDLRHSFGAMLASGGVSTSIIRRCLGHTTSRMTERYSFPSDDAVRQVVRALEEQPMKSSVKSKHSTDASEQK